MVTTVLFQEELQPGLPVGEYILYERIGLGGEGLIFSAWDQVHKQVVAIKFFPKRDEHGAPTNISAELAHFSRLEHPNIREILDVGETNDFLYSVMHYFPMGSLSERIFTQTLSIEDALFISVQLTSALDFLRLNNIVHRDLKPTNVLLNIENHAFLTDFGLAKPISETTQVLHTGHGTPIYAAPEQHTLSQITYKSDLYSFGIMLFEMFTGALPWGGSVSLAIMQLDHREQMPDPRETNPLLPAGLAGALRMLTSLNPDFRPSTAREAIQTVLASFEAEGFSLPEKLRTLPKFSPMEDIREKEACHLISTKQAEWDPETEKIKINYSHFAFLNSVFSNESFSSELDQEALKFMLHGALTFGVEIGTWWENLDTFTDRLQVCQQVIANENEQAVKRTINRMLESLSEEELKQVESTAITSRLVTLAYESTSLSFKKSLFKLLLISTTPSNRWHRASITEAADLILASLAQYDEDIREEAARLIGIVKSEIAVEILLSGTEDNPHPDTEALIEVWESAGSMPRGIDPAVKLQLGLELGWKQVSRDRGKLITAFLSTALAGALAVGLHVFISLRVPSFVNVSRILNMLGNGLLFGPLIALGVFLSRWISLRLKVLSNPSRIAAGIVVGGFLTSLAFMLFHIMYLNAYPSGPLVTISSLVLVSGFVLTNLIPSKIWLQMLGSTVSTALAIILSWLGYLETGATPVLYYRTGEPLRTALLISVFSIVLGVVPYIFNLRNKQTEGLNNE
jgi:serine/threonine protein kinase